MVGLGIPGIQGAAEVGRGGFGVVYRAQQSGFNRQVAVKVLLVPGLDPQQRDRFERELAAMGQLSNHPNIVTVYDAGLTDGGQPYIVMEFMPGGSLAQAIKSAGPMPWQRVADIGIKLASALETAHRNQILHRDLKPENVLVSSFGEPELSDFGIAHIEGHHETRTGLSNLSVSQAPPELIAGAASTAASDIYSLASTLYTLALGRPPFVTSKQDSIFAVMQRIGSEAPPDLQELGYPAAVAAALLAGMAKSPAERPQSALEFAEGLRQAQEVESVPVTPLAINDGTQVETASPAGAQGFASSLTDTTPVVRALRPVEPEVAGPAPSRRRYRVMAAAVAAVALAAVPVWALAGRHVSLNFATAGITGAPSPAGMHKPSPRPSGSASPASPNSTPSSPSAPADNSSLPAAPSTRYGTGSSGGGGYVATNSGGGGTSGGAGTAPPPAGGVAAPPPAGGGTTPPPTGGGSNPPPPQHTYSGELLANPGFAAAANAGAPYSWAMLHGTNTVGTNLVSYYDSPSARWMAQMNTSEGAGHASLYQDVNRNINPGDRYEFSCWIHSASGQTLTGTLALSGLLSGANEGPGVSVTATGTWAKFTVNYAYNNPHTLLRAQFYLNNPNTNYDVKNCSLRQQYS